MSALDAAKRLAQRQEGGVVALAARMKVNANTLAHKLAGQPGHNLFLREAELATVLTQDPEIAQAFAFACGHVCIPVVAAPHGVLAGDIANVGREFGDLMQATYQAIQDGRVTKRELQDYDQQFNEFLAAAVRLRAELLARIPQDPAASKPAG